ncbi:hypothetical protein FKM82_031140 [Ascaphus truei]
MKTKDRWETAGYKPFVPLSVTLRPWDWFAIISSQSLMGEHILGQAPLLAGTCAVELWSLLSEAPHVQMECQPSYPSGSWTR